MAQQQTITIATADTGHFTFQAFGADREAAAQALLAGWRKHRKDYTTADPSMIKTMLSDGDINFVTVTLGSTTRDGEVL
jgi:hypothetical protein